MPFGSWEGLTDVEVERRFPRRRRGHWGDGEPRPSDMTGRVLERSSGSPRIPRTRARRHPRRPDSRGAPPLRRRRHEGPIANCHVVRVRRRRSPPRTLTGWWRTTRTSTRGSRSRSPSSAASTRRAADRVLLRRGRRPHRAQRAHPRPAPEHRLAPLLEPLRRARRPLAAARAHRGRPRRRRRARRRWAALGRRPQPLKALARCSSLCCATSAARRLGARRLPAAAPLRPAVFLAPLGLLVRRPRSCSGCSAHRELPLAEAPRSTHRRAPRRAGGVPGRALPPPGRPPAGASIGRGRRSHASPSASGLLAALPPAELEGVLAHELAHVAAATSLVQTGRGRPRRDADRAVADRRLPRARAAVRARPDRLGDRAPPPLAAAEFAADRAAAAMRVPHGLADALIRLEQASELVEFQASPATEPLYTVNPFDERGASPRCSTHQPVGERVARLRELDPTGAKAPRGVAARIGHGKRAPSGPFVRKSAATYSPGRLPSEYHRRWRA